MAKYVKTEVMIKGKVTFVIKGVDGIKTDEFIYRNRNHLNELIKAKYAGGKKGSVFVISADETNVMTSLTLDMWLKYCTISDDLTEETDE